MKKLLALLMACTTITCAFASCGDEESSESSVSESSVAETTTEEVTEEETTEEETTEEVTEEDTTVADEEESEISEAEKTTYEFIEDADKTAFLGKWECEKLVIEGEEMTDLMGIPLYAVFQLEIKEDGTAVMAEAVAEMSESEEAISYTWGVVSDTEIAIINDTDDTMLFTLDGDYLIGTEEGYDEQLYLAKVDEFTPFDLESFMNDFQMDGMEEDEGAGEWITDDEDSEISDSESAESVAPSAE
ncbi:MAG: hypothetical protein NC177_00430 [Ruminococcus flavefaciens]|nr:hypothetical protein [Ruminococcus flavefaciens]